MCTWMVFDMVWMLRLKKIVITSSGKEGMKRKVVTCWVGLEHSTPIPRMKSAFQVICLGRSFQPVRTLCPPFQSFREHCILKARWEGRCFSHLHPHPHCCLPSKLGWDTNPAEGLPLGALEASSLGQRGQDHGWHTCYQLTVQAELGNEGQNGHGRLILQLNFDFKVKEGFERVGRKILYIGWVNNIY